jgi:hypothetical protein
VAGGPALLSVESLKAALVAAETKEVTPELAAAG